uniref:Uncharacterized protein n=1 Tax=Arundo donax TaxID=35708 RepID=A0A0A9I0H0_ARUDO
MTTSEPVCLHISMNRAPRLGKPLDLQLRLQVLHLRCLSSLPYSV